MLNFNEIKINLFLSFNKVLKAFTHKKLHILKFNIDKFCIFKNVLLNNLRFIFEKYYLPFVIIDTLVLTSSIKDYIDYNDKIVLFKFWNHSNSRIISIINRIEKLIIYFFLTRMQLRIFILNLYFSQFTINLKNLSYEYKNDLVNIKIKNINLKFNNYYLLKLSNINIKINLVSSDTILSIKHIKVIINQKTIEDNLLEEIICIIKNINKKESNSNITISINEIVFSIEIKNFFQIYIKDFLIDKDNLIINYINVILNKKNILWINDITYNFKNNIPKTYSLNIKLYKSSGIKIYNTLYFIKKKYVKYYNKPSIVNNQQVPINNLYITDKNIIDFTNNLLNNFIDRFIIIKKELIFYIKNIELIDPINHNILYFRDISYEQTKNSKYVNINYWEFKNKDTTFIKKTYVNNENFIIKFSNSCIEIFSYMIDIKLHLKKYNEIFSLIGNNINKIVSVFKNRNYSPQKYIFEKFHIQSFSCNFSYIKSSFSFDNFIDGNFTELINITGIDNLNLIIPNNTIMYPKNWNFIFKCILRKLLNSLRDINFKNIVNNKTVIPFNKLADIKTNLIYIKIKATNIINNYK